MSVLPILSPVVPSQSVNTQSTSFFQLQPVALSFGFIYEQNRIWIAEVGDGNMGSAVLGRGLNIDLVSYRPSLNRLSPAGGFNQLNPSQDSCDRLIILRLSFRSVASSFTL